MDEGLNAGFWLRAAKAAAAVGAIVGAIGAIGWFALPSGFVHGVASASGSPGAVSSQTRDQIARELEGSSEFGELYRAFGEHFPREYRDFIARAAAAGEAGGPAAAERAAYAFMQDFLVSKVDAIASAPVGDLSELAEANVELVHALRSSSPRLCAQYVMSGFAPGTRPPPGTLPLLSRVAALQFRAARNGEKSGRPPRGELSEGDAAAWFSRMESIDPASAGLLSDEMALQRAPVEQQCATGVAIYEATVQMPPEQGANITANLIREAMRPAM